MILRICQNSRNIFKPARQNHNHLCWNQAKNYYFLHSTSELYSSKERK